MISQDGKCDSKKVFQTTTAERYLKFCLRDYEFIVNYVLPICTKVAGQPVEGIIMIMDYCGYSNPISGELYNCTMKIMDYERDHYPNLLPLMFMINTTFLFRSMMKVGKIFMDKSIASRMVVLGSDYQKTLLEYIDAENLPEEYGGKCKCPHGGCMESFAGPYQEVYIETIKKMTGTT